jgi:hypothetical protein
MAVVIAIAATTPTNDHLSAEFTRPSVWGQNLVLTPNLILTPEPIEPQPRVDEIDLFDPIWHLYWRPDFDLS